MKKRIVCFFAAVALVMVSAGVSLAENSILSSLKAQGVSHAVMDDAALDAARGTSILVSQSPYGSAGTLRHHVTWKGFGSIYDYASYNYLGWDQKFGPDHMIPIYFAGDATLPEGTYNTYGDVWGADLQSSPNTWNSNYAQTIELHGTILYTDNSLSPYILRDSAWNRPIATFAW